MSSNHYVVRIYPLILPPSFLFPSLHPSRLFPSLCCWRAGRLTTLNILQPLFQPPQYNASSLLTLLRPIHLSTHCFLCFGFSRSAPCLVCLAAAHINRFVLEMFSGTNRVSALLFLPIFELYLLKYEQYVCVCTHTVCMNVCVCMCSVHILYNMCILPYASIHKSLTD